jgi:hypothetical protein
MINPSSDILLFLEKEAKSISSASQKISHTQNSAKPTLGGLGANSSSDIFLFLEKEAKSIRSASRKISHTQNSAKPTLGVWGLAPRKN